MSDRSDFGSFLVGFVIGGLTGAAVALLLTPQSGEETRTMIKEKAVDTYEDVADKAEAFTADAKVKVGELAKEAKATAGELTSKGQVVLEQQKAKVTEIARKVRKTPDTE
jgi:gas vesicle protein